MKKIREYLWIVLLVYVGISLLFFERLGFIALICMFAPVLIAPFAGRKWCGSFCPRGSLLDKVISKFSLNREIPQFLLTPLFRWLIFSLLMGLFSSQVIKSWGNWNRIGLIIASMVFFTTLIAVVLGIIWKPRTWCTAFCPMGTLATALSTTKGGIVFGQGCVSCGLCSKACPMQLDTANFKAEGRVTDPRCIRCGECAVACSKNILELESRVEELNEGLVS